TGKTKCIDELCPECLAEMNPVDAGKYGIEDRTWIRITSRRGSVMVRAAVNEKTQQGTVAVPYHYAEVPINNLTLNDLDPLSRSPQYKICSVKIEIVKEEDLS
ncbi:MAG TPA: formate dehydrogenase subunit alpha, partial [Desulfobacteraceae bacterium]|nr:formate dehydrogenase subunit alpha [Desulfobacteraceae bacterium]